MAIYFACRRCRHALRARRRQAGSPMLCPNCKGEVLVPPASEPSPPPVTVPAIPLAPVLAAPGGLSSRRRLQVLVGGATLAILIVAGSLAAALAWPRPRAKEPMPETEVAAVAVPAPVAADDEEEERPQTAAPGPADLPPAQTTAVEEPSAESLAEPEKPPAPLPTPPPTPAISYSKRGPVALDTLTEAELRERLAPPPRKSVCRRRNCRRW